MQGFETLKESLADQGGSPAKVVKTNQTMGRTARDYYREKKEEDRKRVTLKSIDFDNHVKLKKELYLKERERQRVAGEIKTIKKEEIIGEI